MSQKILLSGVQPTGQLHIGNYFGAIKQCVDLQNDHQCFFMIADYHALKGIHNKSELHDNILGVALDYLALGLDPKKAVIFKQSDVSAHTELCWIFDTLTTMPYLERAHAYKDAMAKNKEISVATFNYPLLMASDILLYNTDIVPAGQDQKQHIEITRDTAQKFNNAYGEIFKLPVQHIVDGVAVVPGTDGQKMSKSYKNTIPLFASDEEIKKAVMGIVTDSGGGIPTNVYAIHALIKDKASLDALYEEKKGKYKDLKEALVADMITFITPLRAKREALAQDLDAVKAILQDGAKRAKEVASNKLAEVKEAIGLTL